jgi:hypothetical protein
MHVTVKTGNRILISALAAALVMIGWDASTLADSAGNRSAPSQVINSSPDEVLWDWLKDTRDRSLLERFIQLYPDSPFAADARARLESLTGAKPTAVASSQPASNAGPGSASLVSRAPQCSGFWCWTHFSILHGIGF